MAAIRPQFMRHIAGVEVDKVFPGLKDSARDELITSVVRQWLTCNGCAGLFTTAVTYWLHLKLIRGAPGKAAAGTEAHPSDMPKHLRTWGIKEKELPSVLHELSVKQSAIFESKSGLKVRVFAEPRDKVVRFEEAKDDGELDDLE